MDTKALRQKILELAIRGKLVPQDPNDEPASVLLERIRAEKQQMVKEGKLKPKDIKNDTVIFKGEDNLHYEKFPDGNVKCIEDEIPFELPIGWAWSRIRNIASVKGGKRLPKGESFSDDVTNHAYIRVTDMKNLSINTFGLKYISEEVFSKIQSYTIGKDDLYVTIAGTIGVVGEVPDILDGVNLTENAVKVCNISVNKTFLCYVILSEFVQQQFQDKTHQVAMPKLALERILGTLIPVCPTKEQQLIVSAINTALQIVDKVESQNDELSKLIDATKSKILDLAIRGKLVPQDPNDEPASVLLERIRAEKEELINQGKIKRDKKESVIFKGEDNSYYETIGKITVNIDNEIPFELPNGWELSRLKSICTKLIDGDHNPPKGEIHPTNYLMLSSTNINNNSLVDLQKARYLSKETFEKENKRTGVKVGDILFTCVGSLGRSCVYCGGHNICFQRSVSVISTLIYNYFLEYFFDSSYMQDKVTNEATGTAQKGFYLNQLSNSLILIPPLNEQKRIADKISQLFSLLDSIVNNID